MRCRVGLYRPEDTINIKFEILFMKLILKTPLKNLFFIFFK